MSVPRQHEATDCEQGSTDWTHIGSRILQSAALASVIHLAEATEQRTPRYRQTDRSGQGRHRQDAGAEN